MTIYNLSTDFNYTAVLALADGSCYFGNGIGKLGQTTGEICFNTAITGYQEILTDPSYAEQIVTFTFPHIGNVGTNSEDIEANKVAAKGLIVRNDLTEQSNYRSNKNLQDWLEVNSITGISGIDTRALTRKIRELGAMPCTIAFAKELNQEVINKAVEAAKNAKDLKGQELTKEYSCKSPFNWDTARWNIKEGYSSKNGLYNITAIDYGVKQNILRCLVDCGFKVKVVPADTSAKDILATNPDGIFLSNGPGDPEATSKFAVPIIKELLAANKPIFGICMGHQLLATALGCKTEKMQQGHRGANHPVKNLDNSTVEITSQNHGFVVSEDIPNSVEVTHRSLFDNSIAGIRLKNSPIYSVQYHPEASPGPHDSHYLFQQFFEMVKQANTTKKTA